MGESFSVSEANPLGCRQEGSAMNLLIWICCMFPLIASDADTLTFVQPQSQVDENAGGVD